ncbi:MAG: efflux RND transporter periplasmic adaptor subunit, partial [bacterium]
GRTESPRSVEIRARVEGFLTKVNFEEGSLVNEGDLLFVIDPRQYRTEYHKANAQLAREQAGLLKARQDARRFRALHAKDAVSTSQLEHAIVREQEAEAAVAGARQAVEQAKLNLSYTKIYAPLSGRIGRAEVKLGSLVGKSEPTLLATTSQIDPIYVNTSISERDYLLAVKDKEKQREGQQDSERRSRITMTLADDSVYPFGGKLNFVDREVDARTSTLPVRLEFPNPNGLLRPGQFTRLRAVLEERKDALLVPQRAVREGMAGQSVFVVDADNRVEMRRVVTGPRHGSRWVIEQGLKHGEQVIVEGMQKVRPGIQVVLTNEPSEPSPVTTTSPSPPEASEPRAASHVSAQN